MIEIKHAKDLVRLRRLALAAQGLLQLQPYGRGLAGARDAIEHLGYVQLDTISVIERAHHHVLYSRVPGFKPSMANQLLVSRDIFEYWSHAAAFLPIADFRFSLPYKHAIKSGQTHWYKNPDKKLMTELLARIRLEGPLRSRDLEASAKTGKSAGWWDWKPAKKAIEQMYMQGDLMVSNRDGFQKTYDLTERVLPPEINSLMPSVEEFAQHIVDQQLRCHGLVSLKGITYLRRNADLRKAVKILVAERISQRELEEVRVNGDEVFVLESGALERPLPRMTKRLSILSPFDNCVIQRDRIKVLFDYDYQIECYVPAPKRHYGYFSLPLLYGDIFIGRMDCKAYRNRRHLEIKSLNFEKNTVDIHAIIPAFIDALKRFLEFQQCDFLSLNKVRPVKFSKDLRDVINSVASIKD